MKLVSCSLITQQPLPEVILTSGKIITVDDRSTITRPVGIKESASVQRRLHPALGGIMCALITSWRATAQEPRASQRQIPRFEDDPVPGKSQGPATQVKLTTASPVASTHNIPGATNFHLYNSNPPFEGGMMRAVHLLAGVYLFAFATVANAQAVLTFGGNAQHSAIYQPAAQDLNRIRWSTSIDLNNTGAYAHYGAPLITAVNTVIVPVKTASGFRINTFNGGSGAAMYSLTTDYILPSYTWVPVYQPVVATGSFGTRLYYPGAGGTVYSIDNPDSNSHTAPVRTVFYTTLANYQSNASAFNSTVFINTPITADASGNIFFGFRVQGTAPAPLNTTQSGFARIDPNGNGTYVLAGTAAGDTNISRDSHNSAPAISNDGSTVYVPVKSASTEYYGYLLGLDAVTLSTKYKVFLKDPRNGNSNNAGILDVSTASPTVAPDGDVYFGIFSYPDNGSRGFLLRYSFGNGARLRHTGGHRDLPRQEHHAWHHHSQLGPCCLYDFYAVAGGTSDHCLLWWRCV